MEIITQKKEAENRCQEFSEAIRALNRAAPNNRNQCVIQCKQAQSQCRNQVESYKLEMRTSNLSNEDRRKHQQALDDLQKEYRALVSDFESTKQEHNKGRLIQSAAETRDENADASQAGGLQQVTEMGDRIQTKTGESLLNTRKEAAQAKEIAIAIEQSMAEQEEKLKSTDKELDTMKENIERSKKLLNTMAKHAAGDRFIQILTGLICLGLIALVLVYVIPMAEDEKHVG